MHYTFLDSWIKHVTRTQEANAKQMYSTANYHNSLHILGEKMKQSSYHQRVSGAHIIPDFWDHE